MTAAITNSSVQKKTAEKNKKQNNSEIRRDEIETNRKSTLHTHNCGGDEMSSLAQPPFAGEKFSCCNLDKKHDKQEIA